MRALTISQPHAGRIDAGIKWIENRTWQHKYRGPLLIHAGKGTQYLTKLELQAFRTGVCFCIVDLLDIRSLDALRHMKPDEIVAGRTVAEILAHEFTEGPELLILGNLRRLRTPIPFSGMQGMWTVPPRLLALVEEQLQDPFDGDR